MKQIDWANEAGGKGAVTSFRVNDIELLAARVFPSEAYAIANYPHCDDMYNILPPFGNGIIGVGGRRSIVELVTKSRLTFALAIEWTGPHAALPVCSMGGISYAGYTEINVYIQAEEKAGACVCVTNTHRPCVSCG